MERYSSQLYVDGIGWDGMGWDGMGWDGMGWESCIRNLKRSISHWPIDRNFKTDIFEIQTICWNSEVYLSPETRLIVIWTLSGFTYLQFYSLSRQFEAWELQFYNLNLLRQIVLTRKWNIVSKYEHTPPSSHKSGRKLIQYLSLNHEVWDSEKWIISVLFYTFFIIFCLKSICKTWSNIYVRKITFLSVVTFSSSSVLSCLLTFLLITWFYN